MARLQARASFQEMAFTNIISVETEPLRIFTVAHPSYDYRAAQMSDLDG